MKNSELVFPHTPKNHQGMDRSWPGGAIIGGLSKRELIAAMAMQGLISCNANWDHKQLAEIAVLKADALLLELSKTEGEK